MPSDQKTNVTNGNAGGIVIDDTSAHRGNFGVLKAITDVEFDEVTGNITTPAGEQGGLDGVTLAAGDFIVGRFDTVKLTSGTLIAYHA